MDATAVMGLCHATEDVRGIGVVMGNAGIGKTYTIRRFVECSQKAVYVKADGLMSSRNLIRRIGEACNYDVTHSSVRDMKNALIGYLRANPCTLVINEVVKLLQANSIKKTRFCETSMKKPPSMVAP